MKGVLIIIAAVVILIILYVQGCLPSIDLSGLGR